MGKSGMLLTELLSSPASISLLKPASSSSSSHHYAAGEEGTGPSGFLTLGVSN